MWLRLDKDAVEIIKEALSRCNLHGFLFLFKQEVSRFSPYNIKHTREMVKKAAETYFSSDDLVFDDYVKWEPSGDAYIMSWQKVPKEYLVEEDCGCGK